MNSKTISQIKTKIKPLLKNKEVLDVILFGSVIKGKANPRDIDIAIITEETLNPKIKGFHISQLTPKDFFHNPPTLATTLLREGFSLKQNKSLAETLRFKNRTLFTYNLSTLNNSTKVKIVNTLRGKNKTKGLVEQQGGNWLANQVFTTPIEAEHITEQFLINFKVQFTKSHILMD